MQKGTISMSNEMVSELYNDYKLRMKSLVDGNDYYEHLLGAIDSGVNQFSLFNRYFEKKIDLRWVDAIEKCIIPLDTIIRNPRKFIVQEEEIVPIERARKITAESVRHLAQHTNMIARVEGDRVTPSQILNVFREESYEIYENRFIYTLMRNLQRFIDQRYDVLYGLSNDETMSSLKMDSQVNNGRERIMFKLEISSHTVEDTREGIVEDTKDATAFQRIERIKRIINEFAHSSFMRELQGCTPVRPPIMRTNVISKDVNFKACLELWQFISAYDEVGYEIITKETDEMVSDEYRDDLYRVFVTNYMLLKNNSIEEENIVGRYKKRSLKPKMLKRLAEELVMNYDMEEVEIRKIFVDELKRVGKKKIAGEEKIKAAIERALQAENARKAAILEKIKAEIQRKKEIEKRRKEREAARIAREKQLEKERIARQKAREKAKKEREIALAKEAARKEKERLRKEKERAIAAEKAAKEKERLRIQREKEREARLKAIEEEKKAKAKLAEERRKAKLLELEQQRKEKEALQKQREKERIAKQKEEQRQKEKEEAARKREREKAAKEKALQLQKEKAAAARQKEKERREKIKAQQLEKERAAKERQREREKAAKEKALQLQKERAAAAREKEKARQQKIKQEQAEKEKAARERLKEKERIAKEKAAQAAKAKAELERQREKERQAKLKAQQAAKEKAAKAKQKEKEKAAAEKAKAQAQKAKKSGADTENTKTGTEDS